VHVPASTLDDVESHEGRFAVWGRRVVMAMLVALMLVGLTGVLGLHTADARAEQDGYQLSVHYATVARAGLDVPWQVTVTSEKGFAQTITLAVTAAYFDIFETQGFAPEPSSSVRNGDTLYLTFDAPAGDTMVVSYDAYIQPSSQQGRRGTVGLVTSEGETIARVAFRTRLLP
jgi:hypothetical protein